MTLHAEKDLEYHDSIAENYDATVVAPRKITNDYLYRKLLRIVPKGTQMLDLGCGTGHLTMRAHSKFKKVIAVDHSAGMLDIAKLKALDNAVQTVEFVLHDAIEFVKNSKPNTYDFIRCVGFLHHLRESEILQILRYISKALKVDGYALFQEPIKIPEDSIPKVIEMWNSTSIVHTLDYSSPVPHPDEEPLNLQNFLDSIQSSGLFPRKHIRSWEIFPKSLPATVKDSLVINYLIRRFSLNGNVLSLIAQKTN